ncbi:MAG: hypothetical protein EA369_03740 [Bradymonadales bacterium]|nr:MAG: hypothetical protein EA369_03740 [Bradymonadales bacterium]
MNVDLNATTLATVAAILTRFSIFAGATVTTSLPRPQPKEKESSSVSASTAPSSHLSVTTVSADSSVATPSLHHNMPIQFVHKQQNAAAIAPVRTPVGRGPRVLNRKLNSSALSSDQALDANVLKGGKFNGLIFFKLQLFKNQRLRLLPIFVDKKLKTEKGDPMKRC